MNDKPYILIDTSVWIEFLRNNPLYVPPIKQELIQGNIASVDVIFGELLQGIRSEKDRDIINQLYDSIHIIPDEKDWLNAGNISHQLKNKGLSVGLIDCYIASIALRNNYKIWSQDKGFNVIQKVFPKLILQ